MGFDLSSVLGDNLGSAFQKIVGSFKESPELKAKFQAAIDDHAAEFKLAELELDSKIQEHIAAQVLAQIEVNKIDAASGKWFQAGWRPACGWVCVLGLLYEFLLQPLLSWASGIFKFPAAPTLDLGPLIVLLGGMLGLGVLRSVDKNNGVTAS